jgi:hypothetical protein
MTLIKNSIIYFRLYEDINNEDIMVIKLIPDANKKIIIINILFVHEDSRRNKTLNGINLVFLKINSKLNSFNLIFLKKQN